MLKIRLKPVSGSPVHHVKSRCIDGALTCFFSSISCCCYHLTSSKGDNAGFPKTLNNFIISLYIFFKLHLENLKNYDFAYNYHF